MFHDQESILVSWYSDTDNTITISWGDAASESATLPADNGKEYSISLPADNVLNLNISGAMSSLILVYQNPEEDEDSEIFALATQCKNWTQDNNAFSESSGPDINFVRSGLLIVGTIDISSDVPIQ